MTGRARLYLRYATRSLRRGGQRTVLAVFCIAVGVMAVVALRLAGSMINTSLTTNVRQLNGGDVSVQSTGLPLTHADLARFDDLQRRGVIRSHAAVGLVRGAVRTDAGKSLLVSPLVLTDPSRYPLVGTPDFADPGGATYAQTLSGHGLVLTQFIAEQLGVQRGAHLRLTLVGGGGLDVTVTGILHNGLTGNAPYISGDTYAAADQQPLRYGLVVMTTADDAHAQQAATELRGAFPAATVQTVQDALQANLDTSTQISRFLQIVGLLALLIGGIGIVNTMQVLLSRRRLEIAMLKATGYRRRDLYGLFAVEAGLLGLGGGLVGTAVGVGLSAVVRLLVERAFAIDITFEVDPVTVLTGVAVGLATALIFGLLPIVRAAAVRPQAVLRDLPEGRRWGSRAQTLALYALLVLLFAGLSAGLIGSFGVAIVTVLATVITLGLLAGAFFLVVWGVGRLPVPERMTLRHALLVTAVLVVVALVTTRLRTVGVLLLLAVAAGYVVAVVPPRVKTAAKLALRSIGRTRGRTATTLVALFVGVFTIGLILVIGQDITGKINDSLNRLASFNVFAIASARESATVDRVTGSLPGLQERRLTVDVGMLPTAVAGRPIAAVAQGAPSGGGDREERFRLSNLGGLEGFDLRAGSFPDASVTLGRMLTGADAGTTNALVRDSLRDAPFNLRPGQTVTLQEPQTQQPVTVHVVGFYTPGSTSNGGLRISFFFQPILVDRAVVTALHSSSMQTVVSLKLTPSSKDQALHQLESAAPGTTVIDLADFAAIVEQILSNLVVLLIALASLALFAGIVIIANTVALAMLERRREIGILKAVGHSSRSVLSQVLVENGLIGFIGAVAGMALVTVATSLLGQYVLETDLAVSPPIVLAIVAGIVALTVATALLVAWGPTRVRPLEVLRYE